MEAGRSSRIKTHHELLHSREFQCCCCLHVRTGTIVLGLLHVLMQMSMVAIITMALVNPNGEGMGITVVKATVEVDGDGVQLYDGSVKHLTSVVRMTSDDLHYALIMSVFFGFISILLIYGAVWGQPSYLMPFFAVMCFDFANVLLRLIGSFAERTTTASYERYQGQGFYLLIAVLFKAYLLNMVYSCYKFLRLRHELLRNPPGGLTGHPVMTGRPPAAMEAGLLLTDRDGPRKYPGNLYPAPPPYATATQMPTVEQILAPPPSYQDVAGASGAQECSMSPPSAAGAAAPAPEEAAAPPAGASVPKETTEDRKDNQDNTKSVNASV